MTSNKNNNPYVDIYQSIRKKEFIEQIIEELEGINFRWVTEQYLEELPLEKRPIGLPKKVQWLVRKVRHAADPSKDKYDFKIMIGIGFMGKMSDIVYVFYRGKKRATWLKKWKKTSNINLKKKKIALIFPSYMSIEERKKWRYLRRKVETQKELGPRDQQFYERYLPEIQNLDAKAEEN